MNHPIDLTGPWRFQPDLAVEGVHKGYFRTEYDVRRWREVALPATFQMCMPILEAYEGEGWFRRAFTVPAEWRGRRVALRFAGVNNCASVWVNGIHVGDHHDAFLPFEFAVQDALKWTGENIVAVRVDNVRRKGEVPGMQRGWRPDGGIVREVELAATDLLRVGQVRVVAEPAMANGGSLAVTTEIINDRPGAAGLCVSVSILRDDRQLGRFTSQQVTCTAGESVRVELGGAVAGVEPWSPEAPNLYTLRVELTADGKRIDEQSMRIGFRRIEARNDRVLLNGKPVFFTGFNRHEDTVRANMCPDMEAARQDLMDMKAAGANFIRLCHYPHHPGELDLCDEIGLLAMDEIPLYWWDGLNEGEENYVLKVKAAERQVTAMINRDFNHPSIVFWSVSNETHEQRGEVVDGNAVLLKLARSLDSTRLITHASNHWRENEAARRDVQYEADLAIAKPGTAIEASKQGGKDVQFVHDDVICVNAYPTLNPRGYGGKHDYEFAQSTRYWREELAKVRARYPDKPIMVSEFGYTSLEGVFDSDFGEDAQAEAITHEFAGMDAPYVCGAVIWCWADHPMPQSGFCRNMRTSPYGVLTRDRHKLKAYWTIQKLFRQKQDEEAAKLRAATRR